MKTILKFSWAKIGIIILLVVITVVSILISFGCGLAMSSSCSPISFLAPALAFPIVYLIEDYFIWAVIIGIIYLYFVASLLQSIYFVIKNKVSLRSFLSFLILFTLIWGIWFGYLIYKDKSNQDDWGYHMMRADSIETKEECEQEGYIWNIQNDCIYSE
jgi:hypothetical protein